MVSQDDKSLVLSLVRDHIIKSPETLSMVPSYTTVRWVGRKASSCRVGGHLRRKALWTRTLKSMQSTCKLQELSFRADRTRVPTTPEMVITLERQWKCRRVA